MQVLKQSFINLAKGLKYVFTPLGIITLFFLIGGTIMINGVVNSVTTMANGVAAELSTISIPLESVWNAFLKFLAGLDWANPGQIINNFFDSEYVKNVLITFLKESYPEIDVKVAAISALLQECVRDILKYLIIFIVLVLLGVIVGYFVTRWLIRHEIVRRKWYKAILFAIVDALILVGEIMLGTFIISKLGMGGIWLVALIILAKSVLSLFEGWLIHGVKKVKATKVFNIKNILFLLLGDVIIVALGAGLIAVIALFNMIVVTVVMALSIVEVVTVVLDANAEGYVRYVSNDLYAKEAVKKLKKLEKEQSKE